MKVAVDTWRGSWHWLKKPRSRKAPVGVWARSAGRYMRWKTPATVMVIVNSFLTLMMVTTSRKLSNLSTAYSVGLRNSASGVFCFK